MAATALQSAAEVLVATGHDPFARGTLRRPVVSGWLSGDAVAWLGVDGEERRSYLNALGPAAAVGALLGELLADLPPLQRVTVPRGTPVHLPAWVGLEGTDWDFRWTDRPVPAPAEGPAVDGVDDDAELAALLAAGNATASAQPGDPAVRRWVGVRDSGRLVACAADTSGATGVGHISSVAVHPDHRGRGLGRAVMAALTNDLLAGGCDIVTLGMYATNAAGRGLYDALGFADTHPFTSGPLTVRGQW